MTLRLDTIQATSERVVAKLLESNYYNTGGTKGDDVIDASEFKQSLSGMNGTDRAYAEYIYDLASARQSAENPMPPSLERIQPPSLERVWAAGQRVYARIVSGDSFQSKGEIDDTERVEMRQFLGTRLLLDAASFDADSAALTLAKFKTMNGELCEKDLQRIDSLPWRTQVTAKHVGALRVYRVATNERALYAIACNESKDGTRWLIVNGDGEILSAATKYNHGKPSQWDSGPWARPE
jgi:hypothetical protein